MFVANQSFSDRTITSLVEFFCSLEYLMKKKIPSIGSFGLSLPFDHNNICTEGLFYGTVDSYLASKICCIREDLLKKNN